MTIALYNFVEQKINKRKRRKSLEYMDLHERNEIFIPTSILFYFPFDDAIAIYTIQHLLFQIIMLNFVP